MRILGNILWFLLGGLICGLSWYLSGILWCITIIGIPYGIQCFKFGTLAFAPFGKEIIYGGGAVKMIVNIIWLILSGIWMALSYAVLGDVYKRQLLLSIPSVNLWRCRENGSVMWR